MAAPEVLPPAAWERLRALLDEALALPPAARQHWLEQLPPEHAAWRDRLASLLAHSDRAEPLLETRPRIETADFAPPPDSAEPGAVGPYQLLRQLGQGGMARVWLAERTDMLQARRVALKLPYRDTGSWHDTALAERLRREREILATLEHPHIARLYDAGVAADGQPWLALEYVAGERIDTHAAALPVAQRLRLFVQVVRAVAHAHAQLVVHRDIKPANMLVTASGDVKLLDFGIAKLLDQGVAEATELTQIAGRAFTPQYASPEQLRGEPLGTGTDIFSLGVVLYELLAGQRPFGGSTRKALEDAVLHQEPRRPSEAAPASAASALRGDLDTIVLKALKKLPRERYATADAFADDIERHLAHQPVLAQPDTAAYRLRRFVYRNRLPVAAGALVAVALGVGSGVALWQATQARAEQSRAEAVKTFVAGLFTDADPFNTTSAERTVQSLLATAQQRLPPASAANAALRVELLDMIGTSLIGLNRFEDADRAIAQAVDEGRSWLGADHALTLRAQVTQISIHRYLGRMPLMQAGLDDLLPLLRERRDPALLAAALTQATHLAIDSGRYAQAESLSSEALALYRQRHGDQHPQTAVSALLLSLVAFFQGDPDKALSAAIQSRDLLMRVHGSQRPHAKVLEGRFLYGRTLGNVGRHDEAVQELEQTLTQVQALLGERAQMVAFVAAEIARNELERDRPAASLSRAGLALDILRDEVQPGSYTMAMAQLHVARAHLALHQWPAARSNLALARNAMVAARGAESVQVADITAMDALAQAFAGDAASAWRTLEPLLPQLRSAPAPIGPRGLHLAGVVRRLSGDSVGARALQEPALVGLGSHAQYARRRDAVLAEIAQLEVLEGQAKAAVQRLGQLSAALDVSRVTSPDAAERAQTMGLALLALRKPREAAPWLAAVATFCQQAPTPVAACVPR